MDKHRGGIKRCGASNTLCFKQDGWSRDRNQRGDNLRSIINTNGCFGSAHLFIAKLKNSVTIAVDPLRVMAFFVACADMTMRSIRVTLLV